MWRHVSKSGLPCGFPGCDRLEYAKGVCHSHYAQQAKGKTLTPLHSTTRPDGTPPRIEYDEVPCPNLELKGPCRIIRGFKNKKGYAQVCLNYRMVAAHRYVWELECGPIPKGLVIDHQCRNRACVNVNHLRVVTVKVNSTENVVGSAPQIMAAKTHCPKGHAYDEENTYHRPSGGRQCRACERKRSMEYQRKKRAAAKGGKTTCAS